MKSIQDCPCCGTPLLVVNGRIITMEEAEAEEMDARYEREKDP